MLDLMSILIHNPSEKHKRMSINNRSAQFASFKSLAGYEDEISETERKTDKKIELDDEVKEEINRNINEYKDDIVEIEFFVKDKYKDGGKYTKIIGKIKKIDIVNKKIRLIDKTSINIEDIINVKKYQDINNE